jgi:Na+/proline symporter
MGWRLDLTILCSGVLVVAYTVTGGTPAVNLTQKYQIGVIFAGMVAAFFVLLSKLPAGLSLHEALTVAGGFHKLDAVDYSLDPSKRYTIWTGVFGGLFLALSYFGTDQSQVQRYLAGSSLRESRLGLMFNALFKIPMQFFILLLGALVFVFYQFERPPVFFNQTAWHQQAAGAQGEKLRALEADFNAAHAEKQQHLHEWVAAERAGDAQRADAAQAAALAAHTRTELARTATKTTLREADPKTPTTDADYVFITFIVDHLPHGLIGLLVAVFFAATFSSKSGELNALGSTSVVDFYRHVHQLRGVSAPDAHYVAASKGFTALWGVAAIIFAMSVTLAENLIQFANIVASIFYGVVLGLFLVAFFVKWVRGTAVFWGALAAQILVFVLFATLSISYLWYNVIGCAACMLFAIALQLVLPKPQRL